MSDVIVKTRKPS